MPKLLELLVIGMYDCCDFVLELSKTLNFDFFLIDFADTVDLKTGVAVSFYWITAIILKV